MSQWVGNGIPDSQSHSGKVTLLKRDYKHKL